MPLYPRPISNVIEEAINIAKKYSTKWLLPNSMGENFKKPLIQQMQSILSSGWEICKEVNVNNIDKFIERRCAIASDDKVLDGMELKTLREIKKVKDGEERKYKFVEYVLLTQPLHDKLWYCNYLINTTPDNKGVIRSSIDDVSIPLSGQASLIIEYVNDEVQRSIDDRPTGEIDALYNAIQYVEVARVIARLIGIARIKSRDSSIDEDSTLFLESLYEFIFHDKDLLEAMERNRETLVLAGDKAIDIYLNSGGDFAQFRTIILEECALQQRDSLSNLITVDQAPNCFSTDNKKNKVGMTRLLASDKDEDSDWDNESDQESDQESDADWERWEAALEEEDGQKSARINSFK